SNSRRQRERYHTLSSPISPAGNPRTVFVCCPYRKCTYVLVFQKIFCSRNVRLRVPHPNVAFVATLGWDSTPSKVLEFVLTQSDPDFFITDFPYPHHRLSYPPSGIMTSRWQQRRVCPVPSDGFRRFFDNLRRYASGYFAHATRSRNFDILAVDTHPPSARQINDFRVKSLVMNTVKLTTLFSIGERKWRGRGGRGTFLAQTGRRTP